MPAPLPSLGGASAREPVREARKSEETLPSRPANAGALRPMALLSRTGISPQGVTTRDIVAYREAGARDGLDDALG